MIRIWTTSLLLLLANLAIAGERNDIKSCYQYAQLTEANAETRRDLVIVIDETTQLDAKLKSSVIEQIQRFIQPGDAIKLVKISAYVPNHYAELMFSGRLELPPSESQRDELPKKSLKLFDYCLQQQQQYAHRILAEKAQASFGQTGNEIEKSDLLASLKQIGQSILSQSASRNRVLFMVSDMLENSGAMSFYAQNQVRDIEPQVELKRVLQHNWVADLSDTRVFVLGAGLVNHTKTYRSPQTMTALHDFWQAYFETSQAKLIAFGQPTLLEPLR